MMVMGFIKLLVLAIIVLYQLVLLAPIGAEVECIEKEREALLRFKAAIGDQSSHFKWSSWGDKRDCCEWEGVVCNNQTGHVIKLHLPADFPNFTQKGEIHASLMELQYLMYLILSYNCFEGSSIPQFLGSLTHLTYLDLHRCCLSGNIPSQLGLLSHLQYLDLSGNWIEGEIPYQLGSLSQLQYLNLLDNNLEGLIPHQLENLSQLRHLDLSRNLYLIGGIPYQLGNLSQLQYLDLSRNLYLTGVIPYQFGDLSQLQYLDLSISHFEGMIPYQLGNLSQLRHLDLSLNNRLTGEIPYQLGNLSQLQFLDLSINSLEGVIPYQFGNLSNLQSLALYYAGTLKINEENGDGHEWLSRLTSLTHLDLANMTDLKYSHKWLQMIAKLPNLKELIIQYNDLSDEYILSLPYFKFNSSSLSILNLLGNNFKSSAVFHWALNISTNLVDVSLVRNNLEGPIPYEFAKMMNSLENLDLGHNKVSGGFKSLGHICTLRSLSLNANLLSEDLSTILQTFSPCAGPSLQYLDLTHNQIIGTLANLSLFPSLKNFYISANLLNGTIPEGYQFPSSLVSLDIHSNSLKGILTDSHLANLHSLKYLDLSDNSLTFRLTPNWVPPFQLEAIYLRSCNLGSGFPEWLKTQKFFTELDISSAGIFGNVPEWFWGLLAPQLKNLNISCNNISGTLPNVAIEFAEYPIISLASNQFEGSLPKFLQNAESLFLSNNRFSDLHIFLCANWSSQALYILDLSDNQIHGQLPDCLSSFGSLIFLDLSNNNFSGEFPISVGSLQQLEALILRNNEFTGELPVTLRSCSNLVLLDAGENKFFGHVPSWIGNELQNLEILILRNNSISGILPTHLCYLSNLYFLDLSLNILSGQIPKCFKNFTSMALESDPSSYRLVVGTVERETMVTYDLSALLMWKGQERMFQNRILVTGIDLSSNKLTGNIPSEIGMLVELISLNLSRNQLEGEIPSEIGQLTSLDYLDLSRNHLFGQIPSSFAQIDRLGVMDLSYNNLSGKIPTGTQLQSFDKSSYEGNFGLCGKPLDVKCPGDKKPQESFESQENNNSILSKGFYWSMAFGFIFGFWGIFGPILFNRPWRHAYFIFLDNLTDDIYVIVVLNWRKCSRWFKGYFLVSLFLYLALAYILLISLLSI